MSKTYEKYISLKNIDNNKLYLFKHGAFYIFISEDAIYIEKTLKLKLTNLTKEIVKCGFPIGSLSKYIRIFNLNNLKFEIVDQAEKRFNALAEEIKTKVISKILKIDMFEISPKEAHNILFEIKKELENNL